VKNGNASIQLEKLGILDERIRIVVGSSYMRGFLIASFGSQKILTKKSKVRRINYKFCK